VGPGLDQAITGHLHPESAAALRSWAELNGITLRWAGWSERGNSPAMLISAYAGQIGVSERKLVLKVSAKGRNESPEPLTHREALAAVPDFSARHLVGLPWDAIPLPDDGWIMFQEIASGSLEDIRPLSTILDDPNQIDTAAHACGTIVGSMLADWNPTVRSMDPFPTAGLFLRGLLGRRIEPGGTVRRWAQEKGVWPTEASVAGSPGPFALVLDDSLTESGKPYVRIGNVHGDLHPGNILIPRDPTGYRLIDLSRFGSNRALAFDPAYLMLTIAACYLPRLAPSERDALAELLTDPADGQRTGMPAPGEVLTAIMAAAGGWAARNALGDEWRRELLLNVLGCALIMTGRDRLRDVDRDWFYGLAQRAAARYLGLPVSAGLPAAVIPSAPAAVERAGASPIATTVLPAGTRLWRVHRRSAPSDEFVAEPSRGLRILPASRRQITAVLEEMLRDVTFGDGGDRDLDGNGLRDMRLSAVRTTRDLVLACADGEPDLAGLWPPNGVHGIEWPSRYDVPEPTLLLLADRCPAGAIRSSVEHAIDLDDPNRAGWLRESLRPYRVRVPEPPDPAPLVFVTSYHQEESDVCRQLDDELRVRLGDVAVFQQDRSLRAGVDVGAERLNRVRTAKVLLVVFGNRPLRGSAPDNWRRRAHQEITEALSHNLCVVPVLATRRALSAEDLPRGVNELARLHPLCLPDQHTTADVRTLVTALLEDIPSLADAQRHHRGD